MIDKSDRRKRERLGAFGCPSTGKDVSTTSEDEFLFGRLVRQFIGSAKPPGRDRLQSGRKHFRADPCLRSVSIVARKASALTRYGCGVGYFCSGDLGW